LFRRIRDDLMQLGLVRPGPAVTIADGTRASPGDLIICTRNDHDVEVGEPGRTLANGDLVRIEAITWTACWSAALWIPTRPPGSAGGPPTRSGTPVTTTPSSAMPPRAAPCTPAWP
jgi:hypothetical protein